MGLFRSAQHETGSAGGGGAGIRPAPPPKKLSIMLSGAKQPHPFNRMIEKNVSRFIRSDRTTPQTHPSPISSAARNPNNHLLVCSVMSTEGRHPTARCPLPANLQLQQLAPTIWRHGYFGHVFHVENERASVFQVQFGIVVCPQHVGFSISVDNHYIDVTS